VSVETLNERTVTDSPVIVGYDGSPESDDALCLGQGLAGVLGAPLVTVSVLTAAPLEIDARTFISDLCESDERLRRQIREQVGDDTRVEMLSMIGPSPARELDRVAGERAAAMVVLGSTHRGPLRRVVPGTVADRLLSGGPCPVAVAPRAFSGSDLELRTVGVGFDGSPEARLALTQAVCLARESGASIELIMAADPQAPVEVAGAAAGYAGLVAAPRVARGLVDRAWARAQAAVRDLVPRDVRATIHMVEDEPASAVIERSAVLDLLILGARGYGPLARVLLGSVSAAVLRRSSCPVVVMPRPDKEPADADSTHVREVVSA
jgi:nucleotide-binding universal stress UspA family protein